MVSGPSDWDVRLVASVPASQLQVRIPAGVNGSAPPGTAWLKSVPTTLDSSGVNEWYADGNRVVGIARANRMLSCTGRHPCSRGRERRGNDPTLHRTGRASQSLSFESASGARQAAERRSGIAP